mmetsp:Transcript_49597/g.53522  ORF Transcript_49597/g.53522 Transcript_49597/m.53522 type:complete len:153 (-) Transcript_49597:224-682(-)
MVPKHRQRHHRRILRVVTVKIKKIFCISTSQGKIVHPGHRRKSIVETESQELARVSAIFVHSSVKKNVCIWRMQQHQYRYRSLFFATTSDTTNATDSVLSNNVPNPPSSKSKRSKSSRSPRPSRRHSTPPSDGPSLAPSDGPSTQPTQQNEE